MLPGFRLLIATFVCSFVLVFGGIHLVAPYRSAQESLATLPSSSGLHPEAPVSALFDVRFAASLASIAPVATNLMLPPVDPTPYPAIVPAAEPPAEDPLAVDRASEPAAPVASEPPQ